MFIAILNTGHIFIFDLNLSLIYFKDTKISGINSVDHTQICLPYLQLNQHSEKNKTIEMMLERPKKILSNKSLNKVLSCF